MTLHMVYLVTINLRCSVNFSQGFQCWVWLVRNILQLYQASKFSLIFNHKMWQYLDMGKCLYKIFLGQNGLYLHQTKQTDCLVHRQLICELGHPSSTRFPVLQHHQHTAVPVDLPTIAWELLTSTAH